MAAQILNIKFDTRIAKMQTDEFVYKEKLEFNGLEYSVYTQSNRHKNQT